MKKTVLTLLLGFLCSFFMHAQEVLVKGQIIDSDSTVPISEVSVSIQGTKFTQTTDSSGVFELTGSLPTGERQLLISKEGYQLKSFTLTIINGEIIDLGTIVLTEDLGETDDFTIALSEDELDEDESIASNTSGILQSSRDVFLRAAAFDFSPTFFRARGLDSEYGTILLNGIKMNKRYSGRPQWSNWGGINDVMRNQEFINGSKANDYSFGGVLGTTQISLRASQYRKGSRVSYASSNRSYTNRVMASHSTGLLSNGWALTVSAGKRWAEEGYVDGTNYDSNSMFLAVEKKINDKHSLNFTGIYTPNRRGKSSAITQEVYDLRGNQYNPYWGNQNGDIRNSRIKEVVEPILMLNHYWDINDKTTLNTNVAYQFGHVGNSRLEFGGATQFTSGGNTYYSGGGANPDPTYYRKLPSYYLADTNGPDYAGAYLAEQEFLNDGQLNWSEMYEANIAAANSGRNAIYALYEDRNDDNQLSINTIFNTELADNILFNAGLNYTNLKSHNYAKMLDLLGGSGFLDVDSFYQGEINGGYDETVAQSNTLTPNRIVGVGDTFRYNYNVFANTLDGFAQAQFKYNKVDFYTAFEFGKTAYQREGLYENGYFQNADDFTSSSLGKGEKVEFDKLGFKGGLTYKISGKHLIDVNGVYSQDAPSIRNTYLNSRQNHDFTPNLTEQTITAGDVSYIFRSPILKTRLTGYYSKVQDATEVSFYYIDGVSGVNDQQAFVQEALTGVDKRNMGIEFGAEAQITPTIKLKAAASIGEYIYDNNPNVTLTSDDFNDGTLGSGSIDYGPANLKNYKIAGGPQHAGNIGFEYRDPKYWWFGATVNYFSNAYLDIASITRTRNFYDDPSIPGVQPFNDYDPEIAKELLEQEQFDSYYLVNLVGGKSWKISDYYLGFFASINNVFNQEYKTGGYEQSRNGNYRELRDDAANPTRVFGPKYYFGRGTTYYLNVYFRF